MHVLMVQCICHAVLCVCMCACMCACMCVCLHACVHVCVYCTAEGKHASTLLDLVKSGYGAVTIVGVGAGMEGEGPAGTTRGMVSMHWSERWCRHGTWTNCSIEISSHLAPFCGEAESVNGCQCMPCVEGHL